MKTTYYLPLLATAMLAVGCNDLDTAPQGSVVTSQQKEEVIKNDPAMAGASTEALPVMMTQFGNTLGTDYHNDFGYPAIMLALDCRTSDMVSDVIGYNWFSSNVEYSDRQATSAFTKMYWRTLYNVIYSANEVLSTISPDTDDAQLKYFRAQALGSRANAYFNLAQLYQFTYVGHESEPCVPLITEENSNEAATNGSPRASVKEVYDQVVSDISTAVELLSSIGKVTTSDREEKKFYTEASARALRARIYLVMNKWADAAADAQWVIANSGATPYTIEEVSVPSFWDAADHSWLLGVIINITDRVVTTGICNWPSHACTFSSSGYVSVGAWRWGSKVLYEYIPLTDVRKGWFVGPDLTCKNLDAGRLSYVLGVCEKPEYLNVKFDIYQGNYTNVTNANDIPLIRIEEMHYILAEAQTMSGNAAGGAATLQEFVSTYRNPNYVVAYNSPEELRNEIWNQRRLEFWGEGLAYFDIMRLNKGIDRRGAGFSEAYVYNIAAGDNVLRYVIPQSEVEGNPLLGENNVAGNQPVAVPDIL